jgi:hypothetical protein
MCKIHFSVKIFLSRRVIFLLVFFFFFKKKCLLVFLGYLVLKVHLLRAISCQKRIIEVLGHFLLIANIWLLFHVFLWFDSAGPYKLGRYQSHICNVINLLMRKIRIECANKYASGSKMAYQPMNLAYRSMHTS